MLKRSANVLKQQQAVKMAVTSPEKLSGGQAAESRRETRISYCLKVEVNGVELLSTNISKNGFQLCCASMRFDGLNDTNRNQALRLSWTVPGTGMAISALGAVRYDNACDDEALIGVELVECQEQQKRLWGAFVEDLAASRGLI